MAKEKSKLIVSRWNVEITVEEQPFPFAAQVRVFDEGSAFGKAAWKARKCGLTPSRLLVAERKEA